MEVRTEKAKKKRKSVQEKNEELAKEGKKLKLFGLKLRAFPTAHQKERMAQFASLEAPATS